MNVPAISGVTKPAADVVSLGLRIQEFLLNPFSLDSPCPLPMLRRRAVLHLTVRSSLLSELRRGRQLFTQYTGRTIRCLCLVGTIQIIRRTALNGRIRNRIGARSPRGRKGYPTR